MNNPIAGRPKTVQNYISATYPEVMWKPYSHRSRLMKRRKHWIEFARSTTA